MTKKSSLRFFSILTETLTTAGYEHYEISNFCKPGMHSRHNTSYWQGVPYLGCGSSAHSFDIHTREWNVASLEKYMLSVEAGNRDFETEHLDATTRYNECLMTGLRTTWGVSMPYIKQAFGTKLWQYCMDMALPYLNNRRLELRDEHLRLTQEGIFTSDGIISDLMFVEE